MLNAKNDCIIQMNNICKSFPGVNVLSNVNLELHSGETHAIVGENGAGKSVLFKILCGIHTPDNGGIYCEGKPVSFSGERDAANHGIVLVHQELNPVLNMSVADNIFLGQLPRHGIFTDGKALIQRTEQLFNALGMEQISPKTKMEDLSIAQIQMVEIARAVAGKPKVLIMDEPTSAVSSREIDIILKLIRNLQNKGLAIVYISHRMDEVMQIATRITVLRDGQVVGCRRKEELSGQDLIIMMSGHSTQNSFHRTASEQREVRLEVQKLSCENMFENISFKIHDGEIVCLAGLLGSRRTEVAEALFGLRKIKAGKILIDGKPVSIRNPRQAIRHGIAFVPEDRKRQGLFLGKSLQFNVSISNLRKVSRYGFVLHRKEKEAARVAIESIGIRDVQKGQAVGAMSGGNQQKVVLAKWLQCQPQILILDDPTRGIDMGARQEIYHLIHRLAGQKKAILLISSDITEIMALSDRVIVMNRGRMRAALERHEISQEHIMKFAVQFH